MQIGAWFWRTFAALEKHLGRHAEHDLPDRLEMGAASLDLLRERVHVAESALKLAAREDRVDTRRLIGAVCYSTAPWIALVHASRTRARSVTSIGATSSACA